MAGGIAATLMGLAVSMVGVPFSASVAAARDDIDPDSYVLSVEIAIRLRESSGFRADRDFVERTIIDRDKYSNLEWGIPLSAAEAAVIDRRLEVADESRDAIRYAESMDSFAGMIFEPLGESFPIFWFTDGLDKHQLGLAKRLPTDVECQVRQVGLTWAALEQLQERFTGDALQLRRDGIPVVSVAVNAQSNSVQVGLLERGDNAARDSSHAMATTSRSLSKVSLSMSPGLAPAAPIVVVGRAIHIGRVA